jgi:DNA-binding CsgD family transcriptional regulator
MLGGVYGLTEAEARLASALSAGHSIESAAANLGVQVTTARSQLKSVFRKVGVNRQQDLTRILASLRV